MILSRGLQSYNDVDHHILNRNIEVFSEMGMSALKPEDLDLHAADRDKAPPVLIVCPGPSAREGLRERVEAFKAEGGQVVLAGSAVRFLFGENPELQPDHVDGVVFNNAESAYHTVMVGEGDIKGVKFYVASHCLPEVYQVLQERGADIQPWHAHVGVDLDVFSEKDLAIASGWGATTGALGLYSALGYRDFKTIGWDGRPEYAYDIKSFQGLSDYAQRLKEDHVILDVDGHEHVLFGEFVGDTVEFVQWLKTDPDAVSSLHVLGGGVFGTLLNASDDKPRTDFSYFSAFEKGDENYPDFVPN